MKELMGRAGSESLRAKLSALFRSCIAQKAGDLPSWQIPLDVYVSPVFRTGRRMTILGQPLMRDDLPGE